MGKIVYQIDTDPSLFVYFKLEDEDEYLLAWTTTPWTLPANMVLGGKSRRRLASLVAYGDKSFTLQATVLRKL